MPKKTKSKVSAGGGFASGGKNQPSSRALVEGTTKFSINPTSILDDLKGRFLKDPTLAGLAILAMILIALGIFLSLPKEEDTNIRVIEEPQVESGEVVVDVSGAVVRPGVHKLPAGSRVSDVVAQAGGFTSSADPEYVSKSINLAQKVSDGAKIYIPKKGESVQSASSTSQGSIGTISGTININTASTVELESLPGIGPVTAGKIIAGRPYSSVDELLTKKVVGQKTFEKIKGAISVF